MKLLTRKSFLILLLLVLLCMAPGSTNTFLYAEEDTFDLRGEAPASLEENATGSTAPSTEQSAKEDENKAADNLVTVNFENVDIRDVARILVDKAGLNMVVGPDVAATVNIQLSNVSWETALDIILKTYNLTYKREGDLLRIMTLEQLQLENEKIPTETKIITLNFARAAEIKPNFQNMLSSRGRIDVNERTNSLIITDIPDFIDDIEEIANKLDTRTPQVMIEALMADVKITQDDQLGINWTLVQETSGNASTIEKSITQNLGALTSTGGQIAFGTTMLTDKDLDATIAFLQSQSRVNILAHPQIVTLDNLPAKINLTEEIPYQQQTTSTSSASAVATTSFKEAGITLSVTPHITTKDNYIYMNIEVKQSFRSGFTPDNQPIIDSRSATTNLLVKNRETAVIGGLRKKNDDFSVTKLPLLGDIPLLGAAFRRRVGAVSDTDLMIFVTPSVIGDFVLTAKDEDRLELFEEGQNDWTNQFDSMKRKKAKTKLLSAEETPSESFAGKQEGYFYLRPPAMAREAQP